MNHSFTGNESDSNKIDRLRFLIHDRKFKTTKDFAKAINVSPNYMSELLTAKKPIPKTLGQKLEDHLFIRRKWFETGEGDVYITDVRSSILQEEENNKTSDDSEHDQKVKRLKELMFKRGIKSIADLAKRIEVTPGFLYDVINAKKPFPKSFAAKLNDKLSINEEWFDTGKGIMGLVPTKDGRELNWMQGLLAFYGMTPEGFSETIGIPLEEVYDAINLSHKIHFTKEQEQKNNRFLARNSDLRKSGWVPSTQEFFEKFGTPDIPKIPQTQHGESLFKNKNVFQLGVTRNAIIVPLVTKDQFSIYPENKDDPEYLEFLPQHCTSLDIAPIGLYRAFQMPDDSMERYDNEYFIRNSISKDSILICRKLDLRVLDKRYFFTEPFRGCIFVTNDHVYIRGVVDHDPEPEDVRLYPLNINYKGEIIKKETIIEVFDIIKVEKYIDWR